VIVGRFSACPHSGVGSADPLITVERASTASTACATKLCSSGTVAHQRCSYAEQVAAVQPPGRCHFLMPASDRGIGEGLGSPVAFRGFAVRQGDADYIKLPMDRGQYDGLSATPWPGRGAGRVKDFETRERHPFFGRLPADEELARAADDTIALIGPLKRSASWDPRWGLIFPIARCAGPGRAYRGGAGAPGDSRRTGSGSGGASRPTWKWAEAEAWSSALIPGWRNATFVPFGDDAPQTPSWRPPTAGAQLCSSVRAAHPLACRSDQPGNEGLRRKRWRAVLAAPTQHDLVPRAQERATADPPP